MWIAGLSYPNATGNPAIHAEGVERQPVSRPYSTFASLISSRVWKHADHDPCTCAGDGRWFTHQHICEYASLYHLSSLLTLVSSILY